MPEPAADDASRLREMICGYMTSQVISVAAALGLADLMARGAGSIAELAAATGAHRPSLVRLLRALVALGLAEERDPGRYRITALGACLQADAPGSLRNLALMYGNGAAWRAWGDLLHAVRTGENAFAHIFGIGSFQHVARQPELAARFDAYMADRTRRSAATILAAHDFSHYRRICDVGGGNGVLMVDLLAVLPATEGVILDTASGLEGAGRRLEEGGVAARCQLVVGDFFSAVPEAADAYLLKSVLHDWDDAHALAILLSCARAMRPESALLIIERLLPERTECSAAHREIALMDLHMLAAPGGRERTAAEYGALAAAADLRIVGARPTASPFAILEAVPAKEKGASP